MKHENEKQDREPTQKQTNNFAALMRSPRLSGTTAILICVGLLSLSCLNPDQFEGEKPTPVTTSRLYCPPDQSPTSTPRIAHRSTPIPSPSPDLAFAPPTRPRPSGQSPLIRIQTLQCYPTHPLTGIRLDITPIPTPSPSPSPDIDKWNFFRQFFGQ